MYPDETSRSAQLFRRAKASIPGAVSRNSVYFPPYPVYVAEARDCRITDVDGNERIDFVNNMTSIIAGHSHPAVVQAVQEQAARMMGIAMPTEIEIELAELICSRVPGVDRVRFANSGTEGVQWAIRAARGYRNRSRIARAEGAYHGAIDCMETSQLQQNPDTWGPADRPATTVNNRGIPASVLDDVITIPFNDVQATKAILEENADDLAAVIVDPMTGMMAYAQASIEYLRMLRDFADASGVVLIYDEVMSFRVGYSGAQGRVGILPDLAAFGKVIGGGLPIGGVGGRKRFMEVFDRDSDNYRVSHSGTYNANPMSMAAGHAALTVMSRDRFDHIGQLGDRLRAGFRDVLATLGVPGCVQGAGSMTFMRFGHDGPIDNYRDMIGLPNDMRTAFDLHYYLLNHGIQSVEAIVWILNQTMTEKEIDFAVEQVAAGLKSVRSKARATA